MLEYFIIHNIYRNAFSWNGQATVEALQSGVMLEPAWLKHSLSSIDVEEIRTYYGCS